MPNYPPMKFPPRNIKDRYYGTNDPVAEAMLERDREKKPSWVAPGDQTEDVLC